jgi:hypothetical protein
MPVDGAMSEARAMTLALGGRWHGSYGTARCVAHDDRRPSLSLRDGGGGRILVFCHGGCTQGDVIGALDKLGLWPNRERAEQQVRAPRRTEKTPIIPVPADAPPMTFKHPRYGRPSHTWPYHLGDGGLAGYIARFDFTKDGEPDKDYLPITFCDLGAGRRGWRSKGIPDPRPLYRLPQLMARPDARILVTEGEKAADAAQRLFPTHVVTTPMHGAKSPSKTDWTPVKSCAVTIWPDHDQRGANFALAVAELAREAGAISVAIVDVPTEFRDGWDLANPLPAGWTIERLYELLEAAPAWMPETKPTECLAESRRRAIRAMGGDLADATAAALKVLADERDPLAAVYVRGSLLMRPTRVRERLNAGSVRRPLDALILRAADVDWLRLRLAQLADFYVVVKKAVKPVDVPVGVCRCVLAAAPWDGLPMLTGIIEAPTVLPNGSVIQTPAHPAGFLPCPSAQLGSAVLCSENVDRHRALAILSVVRWPIHDHT